MKINFTNKTQNINYKTFNPLQFRHFRLIALYLCNKKKEKSENKTQFKETKNV